MAVQAAAMLFLMLLQFGAIDSRILNKPTIYVVGDEQAFKYDGRMLDVAVVNQAAHDSCRVNGGAKLFSSGDDEIPLVLGLNYFIDSSPIACTSGLRMAINATAPPPPI
ncbi:hypothetical protein PTKIN_Ptkin10aG0177200 [Pterospermum kingtungense]